jgi:hypothetical protein
MERSVNWKTLFGFHTTTNPYGHAGIHYSRPDGSSILMNISGSVGSKLVYFFDPHNYLFTSQLCEGNQQGGIMNRSFLTLRINNIDQKLIDAMHEHYVNLSKQKDDGLIAYGLILYQFTGWLRSFAHSILPGYFTQKKGNCAYWTSTGLVNC